MAEAVSIEFDNILAEHLAAERLYYKSTLFAKLDKIVAVLLVLFGIIAVWAAGLRWWTVIWFPLAFLEWFNLPSLRQIQVRCWFKSNPKFSETYYVTLDGAGIHFRTRSIDSRVTWDHFTKVLEDERLWLLVYGTRMYSVIPKRVFKSNDERIRFRTLVDENIVAKRSRET
ncbi:MAG TPA: YcxB family protein [Planctomycetota bacterium]|nr:YcxB family protein [Planctomycetota bacterium]